METLLESFADGVHGHHSAFCVFFGNVNTDVLFRHDVCSG